MASSKVAITLRERQVAVRHAVGEALYDFACWRDMLQQALKETGGPLTKKERAWADSILFPRKRKRKRKAW